MKVIDEKGRIFGVVNLIDLAVLLAVLALAGFAFSRMGPAEDMKSGEVFERMRYTVKVEEVSAFTLEGARVGDALYDYETGSLIGTIVAVRDEPFMEYVVDRDNRAVAIESADKRNLFVTVEADFVETDRAYQVEDMILAVGRKVLVYNKYLFVEGIIYSWDSDLNE